MNTPDTAKAPENESLGTTHVIDPKDMDVHTSFPPCDPEDLAGILSPPRGPDEIGRLGDYRVRRILGRGGMGVVLLAEHPTLGQETAVKLMLPQVARNPRARARFLREGHAAARVKHDNVVHINRVGEHGGIPFIEMELLVGQSLEDRLRSPVPLPVDHVVCIGREVAEGLAAAHAHGLVHRDIKPANIWLDAKTGRVKILDFGLAYDASDDAQLTQSGAFIGTAAFMAPEQALGEPTDARSDLFSLGVVLYRLATGRPPFHGKSFGSIVVAVTTRREVPARDCNPRVPPELAHLIARLLAKNPDDRPQTTGEVLAELSMIEAALRNSDRTPSAPADGGEPTELPSVEQTHSTLPDPSWHHTAKNPRRRSAVAGSVALALLAIGGGVVFFTNPFGPKSKETHPDVAKGGDRVADPAPMLFPIADGSEPQPLEGTVEIPIPPEATPVGPPAVSSPPNPQPAGHQTVANKIVENPPATVGEARTLAWAGEDEFQAAQAFADGSKDQPIDTVKAVDRYRKAAAKGHPIASFSLARSLIRGGYGVYDPAQGDEMLRKALPEVKRAAEGGLASAQYRLGEFHRDGLGGWSDFPEALKWFRKAAEQRHPSAQVEVGQLYEQGLGTGPDFKEAQEWYNRAADQGFAGAFYAIGLIHTSGKGVPRNAAEALKWFGKAAEFNHPAALNAIGTFHQTGTAVAKDDAEAMKWYRKAAEQNFAAAQNALGVLYQTGAGVGRSDNEAVKWYRKSAEQNHPIGQTNLGHMYARGVGVERDPKEAMKWYRKAADQHFAAAQNAIGQLYDAGLGVDPDPRQAMAWFRKAADQNSPAGQFNVGHMYEEGRGVDRDYSEAMTWYRKAADRNSPSAMCSIGDLYLFGKGVGRSDGEAFNWYRKAAEMGFATAQVVVANMYASGRGVGQNHQEAVRWLRKAAGQGNASAQVNLATMYEHGLGVAKDRSEAIALYQTAAKSGHRGAMEALARLGVGNH